MHICDWYATLARIVGVDPTDHAGAAANLPPVDSLDMWDMVLGRNETSPRTEIPLSGGPVSASVSWSGGMKSVGDVVPVILPWRVLKITTFLSVLCHCLSVRFVPALLLLFLDFCFILFVAFLLRSSLLLLHKCNGYHCSPV